MKYTLKDKIDGRYFSFGNLTMGEKGPRVGLRVTPELRQLIAGKQDGEWANLLAFVDDRQEQPRQAAPQSSSGYSVPPLDDTEVPF